MNVIVETFDGRTFDLTISDPEILRKKNINNLAHLISETCDEKFYLPTADRSDLMAGEVIYLELDKKTRAVEKLKEIDLASLQNHFLTDDIELVKLLFDAEKATLQKINDALFRLCTCEIENFEMAELLFDYGISFNTRTHFYFIKAVENGHLNIIKLFLKYGLNLPENHFDDCIHATLRFERLELLKFFLVEGIKRGVDLHGFEYAGNYHTDIGKFLREN